METEDAASTYNLLEDSSLENTTTPTLSTTTPTTYSTIDPGSWYRINGATITTDSGTYFGTDALCVTGDSSSHHVMQRVVVDCEAGSTFLVSAWAKAPALPASVEKKTTESNPYFGIFVRIYYENVTTPETQFFSFDRYYSDWQYRQGIVAPSKDNANKKIVAVIVALAYDNNINTAYFDNVSLRLEPAQTYSYDSNGNPISATQAGAGTENASYSGVDLTQYTAANGSKYTYTYNTKHDILTATAAGIVNTYGYDTSGNATSSKLTSTDMATNPAYLYSTATMSADGNHTVKVTDTAGNATTYVYNTGYHFLSSATNAKNVTTNYSYYTANGRLKQTYQSGVAAVTYTYTGGQLSSLDRKTFRNGAEQHQYYNFAANLWGQNTAISVGSTTLVTYEYEALNSGIAGGGNLTKMTYGNSDSVSYYYDEFDRLVKTVYNDTGNYIEYAYNAEGSMAKLTYKNSAGTALATYSFEYDSLGNITVISQSQGSYYPLVKYTYDSQNQLVKEVHYDGTGNTASDITDTYTYTYDTAGNILSETKTSGGTATSKTYTYGNSNWNDLLTAVNGTAIAYDGSGNPTNYYNGNKTYTNLTWQQGRQLTSVTVDGATASYTYDMDGIRTQKLVDGVVHTYVTQNGKVVRESFPYGDTTIIMDFIYDESGRPFSVAYSKDGGTSYTTYFYATNAQGDVEGLFRVIKNSTTGLYEQKWYGRYTYDAWGNVTSTTANGGTPSATSLVVRNPIRYRGYVYDNETGFYYLQSRYYDPANHRFISADAPEYSAMSAVTLNGTNLFAYCQNNPVIAADENGEWINIVIGAVVGAVVSAVTTAVESYITTGSVDLLGVGVSAVAGAVSGGLSAAGLGALGGAAGALIESGYETYTDYQKAKENGEDWSWGAAVVDIAVDVGIGAVFGAAGSGSKAGFAKSCSISNAGVRGTVTLAKRAVGATTHPNFTIAAKKAVRKMGRYCWNTFKSEVKGSISTFAEGVSGKIYDATVGTIY